MTIAASRTSLFAAYAKASGFYDEMFDDGAALRAHWRILADGMDALGEAELKRLWGDARRLIRENGVTYNVYGDPQGMDRLWELDAVPLVISAEEWSRIEAGLIQRARLFNTILADLYGPQRLIHDGVLPPELVFAHRGFLRALHGFRPADGIHLHLYAVELARSPDGRWWILSDRTQNPSGSGYALENRLVIRRVLADIFRDCRVERLAPFFLALRETLVRLAPHNRDNPHIVLLTPGPYNETYFEHAYLARYLGYTLVEGRDLTVRDDVVFLKTLQGLRRVDVILRRLDDDFCDPLELRSESMLGVAGLVRAARAGNVVVANALGSGLVESAGMMPFLPGLCRHVMGEELLLPSVATWWCGQDYALRYVEENLSRVVVKPAFPGTAHPAYFGETLSPAERAALLDRVRARPFEFVGQEQVALSTAPVYTGSGFQARHVVLRAHLVASRGSYHVMPGGLTRVSATPDTFVVSMQRGGGSKDTWVLASGSEVSSLTMTGQPVELSRGERELSSRVADDLFWLGRYVERAEGNIRLLRSILDRIMDEADPGTRPELPGLLSVLARRKQIAAEVLAPQDGGDIVSLEAELIAFALDESRPGQLRATIASLHRVASNVRDRIATDAWRILKRLGEEIERLERLGTERISDVRDLMDRMIITLAAFSGLGMESMTRGQGWRCLDLGRRIERGLDMTGLLQATVTWATEHEAPLLEALLEVADSSMTYRSRYRTGLQLPPVVDLLVADESNPRSVAFQIAAISDHINHLPAERGSAIRTRIERIALAALTRLRLADIPKFCELDDRGSRPELIALFSEIAADLPALSDEIARRYLSHAAAARPLQMIRSESGA